MKVKDLFEQLSYDDQKQVVKYMKKLSEKLDKPEDIILNDLTNDIKQHFQGQDYIRSRVSVDDEGYAHFVFKWMMYNDPSNRKDFEHKADEFVEYLENKYKAEDIDITAYYGKSEYSNDAFDVNLDFYVDMESI